MSGCGATNDRYCAGEGWGERRLWRVPHPRKQAVASGAKDPPPPLPGMGVGGGSEAKKQFVYLKSASNFGPLESVPFPPGENVSDVGGRVAGVY